MTTRRLPGERIAGEIATAVARNISVDEIVANLDLDAVLARVDLDAVLARIDLDAVVARLDLDAIARRIPIGDIVKAPMLQEAVDGLDLGPALRRAGLADIVAQSVGRSTLDTVRRRVVVIDALTERLTGGILRQDVDTWPAGPASLVGDETGPLGQLDATVNGEQAWNVSGHYVGPLGRVAATTADVFGAIGSWSLITTVVLSLLTNAFGVETGGGTAGIGFGIGLSLWFGVWFLLPLEVFGRTPAMSLLGMRVVTKDGDIPTFPRVLLRTLVQLPSVVLLGAGYVVTLFDKRRRTAHDLVAGTSVIWDWGDGREAAITSPLSRWVAGKTDLG